MGGSVGSALDCYGSIWVRIFQKYKNGRHKQRSGQHTLASQKKNKKEANTL
jgi:hypothetical protein